jgi:hypothetical protein
MLISYGSPGPTFALHTFLRNGAVSRLELRVRPCHYLQPSSVSLNYDVCRTMARVLHQPYFKRKNMTPIEIELFIVEHLRELRMFGFIAALLERLPLIGIVFSISNRIGAAMWAHDLEKLQHRYKDGQLKPEKEYVSKTAGGCRQRSP